MRFAVNEEVEGSIPSGGASNKQCVCMSKVDYHPSKLGMRLRNSPDALATSGRYSLSYKSHKLINRVRLPDSLPFSRLVELVRR